MRLYSPASWLPVITIILALYGAILSSLNAFWARRRDLERIWVRKFLTFVQTTDGQWVLSSHGPVGVAVVNLSTFPVRISCAGFLVKGMATTFDHALIKRDGDWVDSPWPVEIPSRGRQVFLAGPGEAQILTSNQGVKELNTESCVALAATEAGTVVYSKRSPAWLVRRAIAIVQRRR
jgi:hypothetical protein